MSMEKFKAQLATLCNVNVNGLNSVSDVRGLCRSLANATQWALKDAALWALNPLDLPVDCQFEPDTPLFVTFSMVDGAGLTVSQENMLAAVRAAFMYALPGVSPRDIAQATMAFAARWLCGNPVFLAQYLTRTLEGRSPQARFVTDDRTSVTMALQRLNVMPAPYRLAITRLTEYVDTANGEGWQHAGCSSQNVIDFIVAAMLWKDSALVQCVHPAASTRETLNTFGVFIANQNKNAKAQVHYACRDFIQQAYTTATDDQLKAFAHVCTVQYVRNMAYMSYSPVVETLKDLSYLEDVVGAPKAS